VDKINIKNMMKRIKRLWCRIAGHNWKSNITIDVNEIIGHEDELGITEKYNWLELRPPYVYIGVHCLRCEKIMSREEVEKLKLLLKISKIGKLAKYQETLLLQWGDPDKEEVTNINADRLEVNS